MGFKNFTKKKTGKVSKAVKTYVHKTLSKEIETKCVTGAIVVNAAAAPSNWNGAMYFVNQIAQGVAEGQRIGDKISPKRLKAQLTFRCGAIIAGTEVYTIRVLVVEDLVGDTSVVTMADVLETRGTDVAGVSGYPINVISMPRYRYLYDKVTTIAQVGPIEHVFNINLTKKLPRKITYDGPGGGDDGRHGLYICIISDKDTAYSPAVRGEWNLWYDDA